MGYRKVFTAQINVFPELYKDIYFDYTKQILNNWISECFNAYTDRFIISVLQASGIAQFYSFDNIKDSAESFDLKKLWTNQFSKYQIYIYGEGEISYGIGPQINPPKEIIENPQNNIIFKYKESSKNGIIMFQSGRDLLIPEQYNADCCDIECWKNGVIRDKIIRADNWKISLDVSKEIFDNIYNLFNEFTELSDSKVFDFELDEEIGHIEISGVYTISTPEMKIKYYELCKKLSRLLVEDDTFNIESLNMDFYAIDVKEYYIEKYYFDEATAIFNVRNLSI